MEMLLLFKTEREEEKECQMVIKRWLEIKQIKGQEVLTAFGYVKVVGDLVEVRVRAVRKAPDSDSL